MADVSGLSAHDLISHYRRLHVDDLGIMIGRFKPTRGSAREPPYGVGKEATALTEHRAGDDDLFLSSVHQAIRAGRDAASRCECCHRNAHYSRRARTAEACLQ